MSADLLLLTLKNRELFIFIFSNISDCIFRFCVHMHVVYVLYVHVCLCMCVDLHCTHVYLHGEARGRGGVFLDHFQAYFFDIWSLTDSRAYWLTGQLEACLSPLPLPQARLCVSSGRHSSGPGVCTAHTLLAEFSISQASRFVLLGRLLLFLLHSHRSISCR